MNRSIGIAACLLAAVAGCTSMRAPSRQGLIAMEDHRCLDAINVMKGPAAQGEGYSINNLGVIIESGCPDAGWVADPVTAFEYYGQAAQRGVPAAFSNGGALLEFGKLSGGRDAAAAAALYREGARYGDEASIAGLERLGQHVPPVDRVAPDIADRRQKQLDFALLVTGIMVQRESQPRSVLPPPTIPLVHSRIVTPAANPVASGPTCHYPSDCQTGQSCVVPTGQVSGVGVCVTPMRNGSPAIIAPQVAPTSVASCQFDTQCPLNFKCGRVNPGDLNGLCVGPSTAQTFFR
jgi:hypothetical protein